MGDLSFQLLLPATPARRPAWSSRSLPRLRPEV